MTGIAAATETQEQEAEFLDLFRRQRTALLVSIPSSELVCTSLLLRVRDSHLLIDQLMPVIGDQMLAPGMALNLRTTHRGIGYWFKAQHVSRSIDERGFPFHRITRPEWIESDDQRSSFRTHVRLSESHTCRVAPAPGGACDAHLEDISEGGACIRLSAADAALCMGDTVEFSVAFDKYGELSCEAAVCYLQEMVGLGQLRAGIAFRRLSVKKNRGLRRILMQLQRYNIRAGFPG